MHIIKYLFDSFNFSCNSCIISDYWGKKGYKLSYKIYDNFSTCFSYNEFNLTKKQGIVDQDNTYIMNGPSSGSDVYSIIKKGNKLKISKEYSIWYEVIFENKKKYIRKKNISLID